MKRIVSGNSILFRWIPSWMKNKYLIVGVAYLTYMLVFDSNNYPSQFRLYQEVKELEHEHQYFQSQLNQVKQERSQLFSDEKNLEKFARENYYMKMPDETVIVVVEE
jgi:cell division protein DivIC